MSDLTVEDYQDLQDAHAHLSALGDPRADRLKSYLSAAGYPPAPTAPLPAGLKQNGDTTYDDSSVQAARQRYKDAFRQEAPEGYPHHMPGTGLDELSGASLGTGLLAAPLATGVGMVAGPVVQTGAAALGLGPVASTVAGMGAGAIAGGATAGMRGLASGASSAESGGLPQLSRVARFGAHLVPGGRTMVRAYDALSDMVQSPTKVTAPPPPIRWSPPPPEPVRYPAPPLQGHSLQTEVPPVQYPVPPIKWPQQPAPAKTNPVPPVRWNPQPSEPTQYPVPPLRGSSLSPEAAPTPPTPAPPLRWNPTAPAPAKGMPAPQLRWNPSTAAPDEPPIMIEGIGPVRPMTPRGPVNVPGSVPQTVSPIGEPVQPLDKVEMNRMLHAKVQRLNLPGSPAGQKAPGFLTDAAKSKFNTGYDALTLDQMRQLYEHLDTLSK